jgi:hypothetical protein
MPSYEKCKDNTIKKIIKIYEKKKVSKRQGIAIALSIAEKGCKSKLSKADIIKKESKIINFINNKNNNNNKNSNKNRNKNSNKKHKIKLSLINDYRLICEYYIKNKKYMNVINLQNLFMKKILQMEHKNQLQEGAYKAIMKK